MTAVLQVEGVGVSFSGVTALDDVSFSIEKSVTTAIIGPNGAGKTTLLNLLCGLERGTGDVRLQGSDITSWRADRRARAGLARSFQTPVLCDGLSVLDNIRMANRGRRHEVAALCERLQLDVGLDARVDGLTHRDRRLVEVGRVLHRPSAVVLLDEPAAGLSQAEADDMMSALHDVAEETGATVVMIEHNMALVTAWAMNVVVLDRGRVLTQGPPDAVSRDRTVIEAYLGKDWT